MNTKKIIDEVGIAIGHFYDHASDLQIDDYRKNRIEQYLSGLVPPGRCT